MKKILSIFITLVLAASTAVCGFAANGVYINESFDSSSEYDATDGKLLVNGETSVDIKGLGEEFVVELDAVLGTKGEKRIISLKDDAKRRIDIVTASGNSICFSGRNVMSFTENSEVSIAVALNLKTKKAGLYIDGKKLATAEITRRFFSYNAIEKLSFKASQSGELSIDNLRVYSGSEPAADGEISLPGSASGSGASDMKEYSDVIVMFDDSPKALSFGVQTEIGHGGYPFEENGIHYVPLGFVLECMGNSVTEDAEGITSEGDISLELNANDAKIMLNGGEGSLSAKPVVKNSCIYVSDKDIALVTGKDCTTVRYTTVIGSEKRAGEITSSPDTLNMLFREVVFTVPSAQELVENVRTTRPRVMANEDTFEKIKGYISSGDEKMNKWLESVLKMADGALKAADVRYVKSDGLRLDNNEDLGRINELCFAYAVTGNRAYADKAWKQIEIICSFPDWNSQAHFLDTSGVMQSMAICYDWMYDYFSDEQRTIMLEAIRDKGLTPSLAQYTSGAFWVKAEHNWNGVCNAGAAKLAIAVIDEPELQRLASEVLRESLDSIRYMMGSFRPDGAWVEGAGYWYYMTRSLVQYMWTLDTAYGSTFGIAEAPGISQTGYFPAHMVGPNGIFNVSEGGPYVYVDAPELAWFVNYLGDEGLRQLRYDAMERYGFKGTMIDMLLYAPLSGVQNSNQLETDKYYRVLEAAVMRTSWEDQNGIYFGLVGGSNGYNHGHMDAGMFIFDANGVRWAIGLDGDDYNLPGYFAQGEGGQTWDYYRLRAEGHNTLVIDPDSSGGQRVSTDVSSPITRFETDGNGGIAVTDLTRNYDKMTGQQVAKSIIRGAKVDKSSGLITIQDEIKLNKREDIYWFMHTEAEIELSEDGRTAMLYKDGKECRVSLDSPKSAVFTVMVAQPLATSPNPDGQAKNEEYRKLAIRLDKTKEALISVSFDPYASGKTQTLSRIEDWKLSDFTSLRPEIPVLYADGEAVEGFDSKFMSFDYIMKRDESGKPVVPVLSCPEAVEIVYPQSYPGTAYIVLADGGRYCVNISDKIIQKKEPVVLPENALKLSIRSVKADAEQAGNEAHGAIDGNLDTRWSGEGNVSITFDLGDVYKIDYAKFAFYKGDERYNIFSLDTSPDGVNWVTVFDGQSIEDTPYLQGVKLISTKARYVRYNGKGTTAGTWNSVSEAEFYSIP